MTEPIKRITVLFVCLHGSAKSVIATEYLRRRANEVGRLVETWSAGLEPDAELPSTVVAGLLADGYDVSGRVPIAVTARDLERADLVVSFGCDLGELANRTPLQSAIVRWDDVPAVSDGYAAAREDIVRRVEALLDRPLRSHN